MVQKPMAFHSLASMGRLTGLPVSLSIDQSFPKRRADPFLKLKKPKKKRNATLFSIINPSSSKTELNE
jgi:hypothetical protein